MTAAISDVIMLISVLFSSFIISALILPAYQTTTDTTTQVLYKWSFADFQYPNEDARTQAINNKQFIKENVVILDSDYFACEKTSTKRFFVTTPQFKGGIPATLSEITGETNQLGEYLLKPFPNWNSLGSISCEFALSVYRIDKCGFLWVLDSGMVEIFGTRRIACKPKLLIYDLNDADRLIERYEFPDNNLNKLSNLITIVTESYQADCRDSIAYIADVSGYGLIVFNWPQRTSWRVEDESFKAIQERSSITVEGVTFELMDGVFGLALGTGNADTRSLYFHSLASVRESSVPVHILKDANLVKQPDFKNQVVTSEEVREGQSTLEVMTPNGILLFSVITQNAIACWNSATPFVKENLHIVYQDNENLQFISGMKLKSEKTLLITTSRLQNYIAGNLNYPDVKYRVITIDDVNQLLNGTPCQT